MWVGAELAGQMVGLLHPVVTQKCLPSKVLCLSSLNNADNTTPDCWGPFLLSVWNLSTNQKPGYSASCCGDKVELRSKDYSGLNLAADSCSGAGEADETREILA